MAVQQLNVLVWLVLITSPIINGLLSSNGILSSRKVHSVHQILGNVQIIGRQVSSIILHSVNEAQKKRYNREVDVDSVTDTDNTEASKFAKINDEERLQKVIARAGVASRREAEKMVLICFSIITRQVSYDFNVLFFLI